VTSIAGVSGVAVSAGATVASVGVTGAVSACVKETALRGAQPVITSALVAVTQSAESNCFFMDILPYLKH
jgi:hypothetical protein